MRLYVSLRFDKPINENGPFPSVGGFEVMLNNHKNYQFDFMYTELYIDDNDNRICHITCTNPDTQSFPNMLELEQHLSEITELIDCYVDYEAFDKDDESAPSNAIVIDFTFETTDEKQTFSLNETILANMFQKTYPWQKRCQDCICLIEKDMNWFCEEHQSLCKHIQICPENN